MRAEFLHDAYHWAMQTHAPWCPALNWERPGECNCENERDEE